MGFNSGMTRCPSVHILAPMDADRIEPLAVSPRQAAFLTSLSKRKVQELMSKGVIPFRKVGRRTLIPLGALKAFLRGEGRAERS